MRPVLEWAASPPEIQEDYSRTLRLGIGSLLELGFVRVLLSALKGPLQQLCHEKFFWSS